jgi:photosystem II stability/assembly factor-like uncharacterized protein
MSDDLGTDLNRLADHIAGTLHQSDFAVVRQVRQRRSRRYAVVGVAALVVLVSGGVVATVGPPRGQAPPVASSPSPSTPPSPSQPPYIQKSRPAERPHDVVVNSFASAPDGTLFAAERICSGSCEDSDRSTYRLLRSGDLGGTWTDLGSVGSPGQTIMVAAASGSVVWTVSGRLLQGSTDGGRTWQDYDLGTKGPSTAFARLSVSDDTVWVTWGGRVYTARPGGAPTITGSVPPGARWSVLTATGPQSAYVDVQAGPVANWYATTDGGRTWSKRPAACAGGGSVATARVAPDGALWAVCLVESTGGSTSDSVLVTSADGGASWQRRATVVKNGHGYAVVRPVAGGGGWAAGAQGEVLRSTDGVTWTQVANLGERLGFAAMDQDTAVYLTWAGTGDATVAYRTTDGGRTWTESAPFS